MDKVRRDVRRGANRLSKKQSGCGFPGKPKKGRFKKLGLAGEVNSSLEDHQQEMGCESSPSSDREMETKKFKLPKKTFKDANGVDHASVPRKLRSAMKKRNLESVSRPSPASKKLNRSKTGVESPKKDCRKKEKPETESKLAAEPITKDEEEVAEMLYALAGMFPGVERTDKTGKLDDASSLEAKALHLPNEKEAQPETGKVESCETAVSVPSSAKIEQIDEMPSGQPENLNGSTATLNFVGRLKPISAAETEAPEKKPDILFATEAAENKLAAIDEYKSSGLALWPGLSSTVPQDSRDHVLPKPSAAKIPPWMGAAVSPSKKTTSFVADPSRMELKKSKRCASHIYITRLIRVLQTSKNPLALQQNERRPPEGSECGVPDPMAVSDLRSMRNCLEKVATAGDAVYFPDKRYPEMHLLDKCGSHNAKRVQDMTRLAFELYGPQPSRKQSYDFLSLLSRDSKINTNEARNGSASASRPHYPHSHSLPQHHQAKAFSMPQSCHISLAYNNQLPATALNHQGCPQFPPYLTGPFPATHHAGSRAISNHHQQQQWFWAAQYRPAGNSLPLDQYPNLQNGKAEPVLNLSGHNNIPQEQHRLMAMPMNHSSSRAMNRREPHFPLACEETRTPLHLLCSERS